MLKKLFPSISASVSTSVLGNLASASEAGFSSASSSSRRGYSSEEVSRSDIPTLKRRHSFHHPYSEAILEDEGNRRNNDIADLSIDPFDSYHTLKRSKSMSFGATKKPSFSNFKKKRPKSVHFDLEEDNAAGKSQATESKASSLPEKASVASIPVVSPNGSPQKSLSSFYSDLSEDKDNYEDDRMSFRSIFHYRGLENNLQRQFSSIIDESMDMHESEKHDGDKDRLFDSPKKRSDPLFSPVVSLDQDEYHQNYERVRDPHERSEKDVLHLAATSSNEEVQWADKARSPSQLNPTFEDISATRVFNSSSQIFTDTKDSNWLFKPATSTMIQNLKELMDSQCVDNDLDAKDEQEQCNTLDKDENSNSIEELKDNNKEDISHNTATEERDSDELEKVTEELDTLRIGKFELPENHEVKVTEVEDTDNASNKTKVLTSWNEKELRIVKEIVNLLKEEVSLTNILTDFSEEVDTETKEEKEDKDEEEEIILSLKRGIEELMKKFQAMKKEKENLEVQVKNLSEQVELLKETLNGSNTYSIQTQQILDSTRNETKVLQEQIKLLQDRFSVELQRKSQLNKRLQDIKKNFEISQQSLGELNKSKEDLDTQVASLREELADLKRNAEEYIKNMEEVDLQLQEELEFRSQLEKENHDLKTKLFDANTENESLTNSLQRSQLELSELNEKHNNVIKSYKSLVEGVVDLKHSKEISESRLEGLSTHFSNIFKENQTLLQQNDQYRNALTKLKEHLDLAETESIRMRKEIKAISADNLFLDNFSRSFMLLAFKALEPMVHNESKSYFNRNYNMIDGTSLSEEHEDVLDRLLEFLTRSITDLVSQYSENEKLLEAELRTRNENYQNMLQKLGTMMEKHLAKSLNKENKDGESYDIYSKQHKKRKRISMLDSNALTTS